MQPWVPWTLATLIVSTAFAVWLSFRFLRIAPVLAGLDRAIALVEASQGPSGFRRGFKSTYQQLADDPIVGTVWRAYALTIGAAPGTDEVLGYSRRPHESFDDGLLVVAGVNLRLYRAVPNLLVGSGLLFTFVGLVGALYFGSRGIGAGDIKQAQQALHELLAAATFKFTTSIAGLGSSLVYSWREKALLYRVQYRLARFCAALEERMVPITIASIVLRSLGEPNAQQAEQRWRCGHSVAPISDKIASHLADELGNAVAPLREAIASAVGRAGGLDQWIRDAIAQCVRSEFQVEFRRRGTLLDRSLGGARRSMIQVTIWWSLVASSMRRLGAVTRRICRRRRSSDHLGSMAVSSSAAPTGYAGARDQPLFDVTERG